MTRPSTLARLAPLAQDQGGLLTRRQARRAGVSQPTIERLVAEGSVLERVAHGVYRLVGTPIPGQLELRAAWLQLAPDVLVWEREPLQGVVSHRSAGSVYGIGHLPADQHHFTTSERKQSRRPDVRMHRLSLAPHEWTELGGLLVTRPSRIAADLMREHEDPAAVGQLIADAIREAYDHPARFAPTLAPYAMRYGFRHGDGHALLRWLLDLSGDPERSRWLAEAHDAAAASA